MSHPNALLTPRGRLQLAQCVVDQCWSLRRAAERFQVSVPTAARWAQRYREHGPEAMEDRSSRPHSSPRRTATRTERRIIAVRVNRRWGPARIGYLLGIHPSTVHRVLSRYRLAKLTWLDRGTGRVIRRYEHDRPGDLIHVDIKKLGRIPDGGGHRVLGRIAGWKNKTGTRANRRPGYHYLHNAVDDYSRLAYVETLPDIKGETCAGFWQRAQQFFANHDITIEAVMTDNWNGYRSGAFQVALAGIEHVRTRPYRPQTNGKVERFNRTLTQEWAYARPYLSENDRNQALAEWIHIYNHHRGHTAIGGPPITRVNNQGGSYT